MKRQALDIYDDMPVGMKRYIKNFGWHFSQKACDYAVSLMRRLNTSTNKLEKIEPMNMENMKELTKKYGINVENDVMCDGLYVLNMGKADYYKKSIPDEQHLVQFVKDTIDDVDGADGNVMRCWYAKMVGSGMPVDWEEMI